MGNYGTAQLSKRQIIHQSFSALASRNRPGPSSNAAAEYGYPWNPTLPGRQEPVEFATPQPPLLHHLHCPRGGCCQGRCGESNEGRSMDGHNGCQSPVFRCRFIRRLWKRWRANTCVTDRSVCRNGLLKLHSSVTELEVRLLERNAELGVR